LPEQIRLYKICTLLHCLPTEIEEQPAALIDWILAIDDIHTIVRNKVMSGEA